MWPFWEKIDGRIVRQCTVVHPEVLAIPLSRGLSPSPAIAASNTGSATHDHERLGGDGRDAQT